MLITLIDFLCACANLFFLKNTCFIKVLLLGYKNSVFHLFLLVLKGKMSSALQWELIKRTSCFIVKDKQTGASFSKVYIHDNS